MRPTGGKACIHCGRERRIDAIRPQTMTPNPKQLIMNLLMAADDHTLSSKEAVGSCKPVSYTHLTLPTKRIV